MSIHIKTNNPRQLLNLIVDLVKDGNIQTWSVDNDGDFTHDVPQWKYKAWLTPTIIDEELIFGIIPPRANPISTTIYAVYHGRFAEMLLAHLDKEFIEIRTTALPTSFDIIDPKL